VIVACTSGKRFWDDLATRKPHKPESMERQKYWWGHPDTGSRNDDGLPNTTGMHSGGAPLLDYWEIPPGGYQGAHYAVFPQELVVPLVKAMTPQKVCLTCGEPSRRIVETSYEAHGDVQRQNAEPKAMADYELQQRNQNAQGMANGRASRIDSTIGFTDCGHDNYRPGRILDPFAGSGTTLAVAVGHGHDAIGIDIDSRNADLARERVGPMFFDLDGASYER
jgi:hypothetical protein